MENLKIYNTLKVVPVEYLKTIQAGRLKGMSDIKPQWRIMKMTEVFGVCGFGWKICNIQFKYTNGSDNQVVCSCYLDLHIKVGGEWSDAIPGVGGSAFIANESKGLYTSDEAEKMAYTDAISVATKMIGLAGDVYIGHGGKYETKQSGTETQNNKEQKPLLSSLQLKSAIEQIQKCKTKADLEVIKKKLEAYQLNEPQQVSIDLAIKNNPNV